MECSSRELDANLDKITRSIEVHSPKSVFLKEKYIIQQKILNHLINIYQAKAKYNTPKAKSTAKEAINYKRKFHLALPLPSIHPIYPLSPVSMSQAGDQVPHNTSLQSPKEKKETQRDKLNDLKDLLKKKTKQKAKEQKEYLLILKDNLCVYKGNLRLENIHKRNIVLTKKRIMNESIVNYKQCKRCYIDLMTKYDVSQLTKENKNKKHELAFWKKQTEEKLKKSNSMSSYLFMTQNNINKQMNE